MPTPDWQSALLFSALFAELASPPAPYSCMSSSSTGLYADSRGGQVVYAINGSSSASLSVGVLNNCNCGIRQQAPVFACANTGSCTFHKLTPKQPSAVRMSLTAYPPGIICKCRFGAFFLQNPVMSFSGQGRFNRFNVSNGLRQ